MGAARVAATSAAVAAAGRPGCTLSARLSASAGNASVLMAGAATADVSPWLLLLLLVLAGLLMAGGACATLAAAPASASAVGACSAAALRGVAGAEVSAGAADAWPEGTGAIAARETPCLRRSLLLEAAGTAASAVAASAALALSAGAADAALAGDSTGDRSPAALAAAMVAGLLVPCAEAALLLARCCWPSGGGSGRVVLVPLSSPAFEGDEGAARLVNGLLAGVSSASMADVLAALLLAALVALGLLAGSCCGAERLWHLLVWAAGLGVGSAALPADGGCEAGLAADGVASGGMAALAAVGAAVGATTAELASAVVVAPAAAPLNAVAAVAAGALPLLLLLLLGAPAADSAGATAAACSDVPGAAALPCPEELPAIAAWLLEPDRICPRRLSGCCLCCCWPALPALPRRCGCAGLLAALALARAAEPRSSMWLPSAAAETAAAPGLVGALRLRLGLLPGLTGLAGSA